jgi:hypothetical protein
MKQRPQRFRWEVYLTRSGQAKPTIAAPRDITKYNAPRTPTSPFSSNARQWAQHDRGLRLGIVLSAGHPGGGGVDAVGDQ